MCALVVLTAAELIQRCSAEIPIGIFADRQSKLTRTMLLIRQQHDVVDQGDDLTAAAVHPTLQLAQNTTERSHPRW